METNASAINRVIDFLRDRKKSCQESTSFIAVSLDQMTVVAIAEDENSLLASLASQGIKTNDVLIDGPFGECSAGTFRSANAPDEDCRPIIDASARP